MKKRKVISLVALLFLLALVLSGCSGGSGSSSSSDELVLSKLAALNSETIEATFNDSTTYETRDFESDGEYLTSEEQEVSFLYKGVTYSGKVSYSGTEFTGTIIDSSSSSLASKIINKIDFITETAFAQVTFPIAEKENIIVHAVGPNGNSYLVDTVSDGKFNLRVKPGDQFILILSNTAGEFVGILEDSNGDTVKISATNGRNNLGEINVDPANLSVSASNLSDLNPSPVTINNPEEIEYIAADSISSTLFLPSENNSVSILAEGSGFNITLGKLDYSDQLNKPIYIEGTFYYEGTPGTVSDFTLKREDYFYYENKSKYLWKYNEYNNDGSLDTAATPNDVIMPALFEKGKVYTANVYGTEASYSFDSIIGQFTIDGATYNREIIKIDIETVKGERSSYYAKGIGFVSYENTEGNAGDVEYARAGGSSVGTKPSWLDSTLEDNLKAEFGD